MTVDFKHLRALAEQELETSLSEALAAKAPQYQNVNPEEILDLLEEAAETYTVVESVLPHNLRHSARKELEFFVWVYQDTIKDSRPTQNRQPPQNILQLLSR